MHATYSIESDPMDVLAKVRSAFETAPTSGTSVVFDCGPFFLARNEVGVFLNLNDSDSVWQVYGASVRRALLDDLLCFVADDVSICFPFGDGSAVPDFEVSTDDASESMDTTDGICDSICEGFPEPEARGIWVPTKYSDGNVEWSAQINHRYVLGITATAVLYCEDVEEPFDVMAVEAHSHMSCMPGLHVITDSGIVFYFRTPGIDDDEDPLSCINDDAAYGGA